MGPSYFWDRFLRHNPVLLWLERRNLFHGSTFALGPLVGKRIMERMKYYEKKKISESGDHEDLLDNFLRAKQACPKAVTNKEVIGLSLTMFLAGADTVLVQPLLTLAIPPPPSPSFYFTKIVQLIRLLHPSLALQPWRHSSTTF